MTIVLELKPETEARAEACAAAVGMPVAEYLQHVMEQAIPPFIQPSQRISLEEFDSIMDDLAEGSEGDPVPPIFNREEIYGDRS